MDKGFILLHRKIKNHWLWNPERPEWFLWWADIIFSANFKPVKLVIKGESKFGETGKVDLQFEGRYQSFKSAEPKVKGWGQIQEEIKAIPKKALPF